MSSIEQTSGGLEFPILDSIPNLGDIKSFTNLYFSKYYLLDVNGIENNDIMFMFYTNRIAFLSLAPSHFFFNEVEEYDINFYVGKCNRQDNNVQNKGEIGGQILTPTSVIGKVDFKDGSGFEIPCGVSGALVKINEELLKTPELLKNYPDSDGFIAIILSTFETADLTSDNMKNNMITHEEYIEKFNC